MLVIWIIVLAVIIWAVWNFGRKEGFFPSRKEDDSPLDILKRRFASGEISEEEFEERKAKLEEKKH